MKSIKQQYLDLKEGKMTQAQFMRNTRMSLPQYVTNVTSFNDTIKILRNKAILTEADIKDKDQEKLERYNQYTYTLNGKEVFPEIAFINNILKAELDDTLYRLSEPIDGVIELNPIKGKTGMYTEADIKSPLSINGKVVASYTQNGDKSYNVAYENGDTETIAVSNDIWDKINALDKNSTSLNESYTTNTSGKELYSRFAEIDNLNGQEVLIGIDYEIEKNRDLTKKEATKIVIKNLKKNQFYYTDTLMSGVEGYKAQYMNKFKPGSDQMRDVKSNDLVDKTNGMTSPKGIEKAKASSNKAKKETNEPEAGIKLMSLVAKTVRGVKKMDATGEKMKKLALKENINWDSISQDDAYSLFDYHEKTGMLPLNLSAEKFNQIMLKYNIEADRDEEIDPAGGYGLHSHIEENQDVDLNTLNNMLNNHDWYYRMSDDERVYDAGKAMEDKLQMLARELGQEGIDAYNEVQLKIFPKNAPLTLEKTSNTFEKIKSNNPSNPKLDALKDKINKMVMKEYSTMPGGDNMTDVAGHQMDEAKASSLLVGDKFKIAADLGKFVMGEEVEVVSVSPFGNDIRLVLSNGKDKDDFYLDKNDEI